MGVILGIYRACIGGNIRATWGLSRGYIGIMGLYWDNGE